MIFGEKWHDAGTLAQVFAFIGIPFALNYFASPVLGAMGDSGKQRTLAIVQLVTTIALTLLALPHGLLWVAVAYVVRSYLTLPLQILFLRQASGIRFTDTWAAVRGPFLAAAGLGLAVWAPEAGGRRAAEWGVGKEWVRA